MAESGAAIAGSPRASLRPEAFVAPAGSGPVAGTRRRNRSVAAASHPTAVTEAKRDRAVAVRAPRRTKPWPTRYRSATSPASASAAMTTAYDFSATDIDGRDQSLDRYRGKVLLIVNVASKCGFTPQYTGLERLQRDYHGRGFEVLGFPCDQFGHQEPGDEAEIKEFCSLTYDVSFPLYSKIDVNGDQAHPLWRWLKDEKGGFLGIDAIKWNFTKFLVGRDGRVIKRYAPTDKPESIAADIEKALAA